MTIVRSSESSKAAGAVWLVNGKPLKLNDGHLSAKEAKALIRALINHIERGCPAYVYRGEGKK